jgi:hypothetical protein
MLRRVFSVSKTPIVNVFETYVTLPGRSDVSLAATTPCRLQLCSATERS